MLLDAHLCIGRRRRSLPRLCPLHRPLLHSVPLAVAVPELDQLNATRPPPWPQPLVLDPPNAASTPQLTQRLFMRDGNVQVGQNGPFILKGPIQPTSHESVTMPVVGLQPNMYPTRLSPSQSSWALQPNTRLGIYDLQMSPRGTV